MINYRVTIIQANPVWQDPPSNLALFEQIITGQIDNTDAVLLPEMFTTGFTMNSAEFAETTEGNSVNWMKRLAGEKGFSIGGSLIIKEGGNVYNRFIWALPEGNIITYDKRHLFFLERESNSYSRGKNRVVVTDKGFRILLSVCYDLRFPVWLRNRNDYDAIFLVANWPAARREVWEKLLMARAIENQCYVAAVNRVGTDGNGLQYSGESMVVNPRGKIMHKAIEGNEEIFTSELNLRELHEFRHKFPVWLDADDFDLKF